MTDEFEPKKPFDPGWLYIRTDEKYEEVRGEIRELDRQVQDQKNNVARIEKRVDFGVAITGQKNADDLAKQAILIATIKQTQELEQLKLLTLEKDLLGEIKKIKDILEPIYKGIVAIFFTLVAGGAVLYVFKTFKFN